MTDKKQPEALRLAELLTADEWPGHMTLVSYTHDQAAVELRRQHTELETLRAGYAAARLEIESLRDEVKEYRHAAGVQKTLIETLLAEKPAGAQQPGTAYAALPECSAFLLCKGSDVTARAWNVDQMRAFADATHALRVASHGQAPAQQGHEWGCRANAFGPCTCGQAPAQAAPAAMHQHLLDMLGAKDHEHAATIIAGHHARELAAPAAVAGQSEFPHEQMDVMALARYKVMPSHESMFHRFAVVAGDGSQQLYIGREVECENMARKFAGAFLDGAFAFHSMLAAAPTTQPAPQQEAQEPHGWLYEWTHSSATGKPDATYTAFTTDEAHASKHDNCRAVYTAPQPSPASQGDALDAEQHEMDARHAAIYRWMLSHVADVLSIFDNWFADEEADTDELHDALAARAAQEGKSNDN